MKLLNKINRPFIGFASILILVGAFVIYLLIYTYVMEEAEENLYLIKARAVKNINSKIQSDFYPILEVDTISTAAAKLIEDSFTDTMIFDPVEHERERFLQLISAYVKDSVGYRIITRSTNIHAEDILFSVGVPILALLVIILITSFFIINRISFSIWKPFYSNIKTLKKFSASDKEKIQLLDFDIDEFTNLNESLLELTEKIRRDYNNLKVFSENISHELQTPLAIIKTKTELMIQDSNLDIEKIKQLQIINKTVNRLSKLNSSLILLVKIESADYSNKKEINLNGFIKQKIGEIFEIAESAGITITTNFNEELVIKINEFLFEIMFSNLITNAIKHNIENGTIEISLAGDKLTIKNTGKAAEKEPTELFERFVKGAHTNDSTGLGLTIVKQICEINKFGINYTYADNFHLVEIIFIPVKG